MNLRRLPFLLGSLGVLLGVAVDTSCTVLLEKNTSQCSTDGDCAARGADWQYYVCSPDNLCVKPATFCATNQQCLAANAGQPFQCRKDVHKCFPLLQSPDCTKVWSTKPEDLANDDILYVGLVTANTGAPGQTGPGQIEGAELARQEFMKSGGLSMGSKKRPVAFISCDNNSPTVETALHFLVDSVRVQSILGPANSGVMTTDGPAILEPAGVIGVSGGASGVRGTVFMGSGGLLWRTQPGDLQAAQNTPKFVAAVAEPLVRAKAALAATDQIKIMVVNPTDALGALSASYLNMNLQFNGSSAVNNGTNYKNVDYGNPATDSDTAAKQAKAAQAIIDYGPNIVIFVGRIEVLSGLIKPVEAGWNAASHNFRPYYISFANLFTPATAAFLSAYPDGPAREDLRHRMVGLAPTSPNPNQLALYKIRHHSVWDNYVHTDLPPFTGTTAPPTSIGPSNYSAGYYDATYVLFTAMMAAGKEDPTGSQISAGIAKTQPAPGAAITDVGPDTVSDITNAVVAGRTVDLNGVLSDLNFASGYVVTNMAVWCLQKAGANGQIPSPVESGYGYDVNTNPFGTPPAANGAFQNCP